MLIFIVSIAHNPRRATLKRVNEVNQESLRSVEERVLGVGADLYTGSNLSYVQNGDTVPVGTTHLSVLINGKVEDVAMSPIASCVVSLLTETSATIGWTPVKLQRAANKNLTFSTVAAMKTGRTVVGEVIDDGCIIAGDIKVKTQSYKGGWAALKFPVGASEYILTTRENVRTYKDDANWEPDGTQCGLEQH